MDCELFEKIDYDLCIQGDATVDSKKHRFMIVKTLACIPKDVREKVLAETLFIMAIKGVKGTTFSLNVTSPQTLHFILLNLGELEGESEPVVLSCIAHEIAHFVCEHRISGGPDVELEADNLIEKWGFRRAYENE